MWAEVQCVVYDIIYSECNIVGFACGFQDKNMYCIEAQPR